MLRIKIFTLFPEVFPGTIGVSVPGRAIKNSVIDIEAVNLKDFTIDNYKTADDYPYGGGSGMVMKADVIGRAMDYYLQLEQKTPLIIVTSPSGVTFNQNIAKEIMANIVNKSISIYFICGRFEGIDRRFIEHYNALEISIGDYILFGGEAAVMVMCEAMLRLVPGVIQNNESLYEESFNENSDGNFSIEYPHYTRPNKWNGLEVPDVLLSGHHKNIAQWRLAKSKEMTEAKKTLENNFNILDWI